MLASTGDAVRSVMGCVTVCKLCVRQKGNGWQCDDNAKKKEKGVKDDYDGKRITSAKYMACTVWNGTTLGRDENT